GGPDGHAAITGNTGVEHAALRARLVLAPAIAGGPDAAVVHVAAERGVAAVGAVAGRVARLCRRRAYEQIGQRPVRIVHGKIAVLPVVAQLGVSGAALAAKTEAAADLRIAVRETDVARFAIVGGRIADLAALLRPGRDAIQRRSIQVAAAAVTAALADGIAVVAVIRHADRRDGRHRRLTFRGRAALLATAVGGAMKSFRTKAAVGTPQAAVADLGVEAARATEPEEKRNADAISDGHRAGSQPAETEDL